MYLYILSSVKNPLKKLLIYLIYKRGLVDWKFKTKAKNLFRVGGSVERLKSGLRNCYAQSKGEGKKVKKENKDER